MEPIRIGFIGLGGIVRERHIPGLRRIAGLEFVAVCNRSRASSEEAAAEYGIQQVCDHWKDIVSSDGIDAVVIGTWPYMHHPVSIAALKAGKHVFCQARMAMNAEEAQEMHDAWRASGKAAMLCPVPYGLSVDATIRRLLAEEALGEIRLVRVQSFQNTFASAETAMNWRKDHRLSGFNVLTLGMYVEVIHRWFGWTSMVSAHTQTFAPVREDETGTKTQVRIPDQVLVHSLTERGLPVEYTISGVVEGGRDAIEIYGSAGSLRYDSSSDTLSCMRNGRDAERVEQRPDERYDVESWRVEEDFIGAIRNGAEYHPNFEDGRRYMQVVQAVHDSAAHEQPVRLGTAG
jgi:predicted dehydrogenase